MQFVSSQQLSTPQMKCSLNILFYHNYIHNGTVFMRVNDILKIDKRQWKHLKITYIIQNDILYHKVNMHIL